MFEDNDEFDGAIKFEPLEGECMQNYEQEVVDYFSNHNFEGRLIKKIPEFSYDNSDEFILEATTHQENFIVEVFRKTDAGEAEYMFSQILEPKNEITELNKQNTVRCVFRELASVVEILQNGEPEPFLDFF